MSKKTPRRKLLGFIAGEKGSIGKLQALALGIGGMIASGLFIPTKDVEADGYNDHEVDAHYNWNDGAGHGDYTVPQHVDHANDAYQDDEDWWENVDTWSYHNDDGYYTDHIDHDDYSDWYNWPANWTNSPPSVEVEVE